MGVFFSTPHQSVEIDWNEIQSFYYWSVLRTQRWMRIHPMSSNDFNLLSQWRRGFIFYQNIDIPIKNIIANTIWIESKYYEVNHYLPIRLLTILLWHRDQICFIDKQSRETIAKVITNGVLRCIMRHISWEHLIGMLLGSDAHPVVISWNPLTFQQTTASEWIDSFEKIVEKNEVSSLLFDHRSKFGNGVSAFDIMREYESSALPRNHSTDN